MLWDDEYFYVAAEMEEPDLWGTLTERDSVIFHDNDFEVFIDPDGDTHAYYELEVNALGTPWDLMLIKPYRDGGRAIDAWDIAGLQVGVDVRGTLNRPGDRDDGWSDRDRDAVARFFARRRPIGSRRSPAITGASTFRASSGRSTSPDGRYAKRLKPGTQGSAARETTGCGARRARSTCTCPSAGVTSSSRRLAAGSGTEAFVDDPNERVKWALRRLYYRQRDVSRRDERATPPTLDALEGAEHSRRRPRVPPSAARDAVALRDRRAGFDGAIVHIDQDGRVWVTR